MNRPFIALQLKICNMRDSSIKAFGFIKQMKSLVFKASLKTTDARNRGEPIGVYALSAECTFFGWLRLLFVAARPNMSYISLRKKTGINTRGQSSNRNGSALLALA